MIKFWDTLNISATNPYWTSLQPLEIYLRSNRTITVSNDKVAMQRQFRALVTASVAPFTETEKRILAWYIGQVMKIMESRAPRFATINWNLVKTVGGYNWNYPYTLEDTIVLPESWVEEAVSAYNTSNADIIVSKFKSLFHERVHIYERMNGAIFSKMAHDFWGFQCVEPSDILFSKRLVDNWVTNPDAMDIRYIVSITEPGTNGDAQWYLPLLTIIDRQVSTTASQLSASGPTGVLVPLDGVWDATVNRFQYYTRDQSRPICSSAQYTNRFYGMDRQLYHPNEIMANLLTDWVVTYKEYDRLNTSSTAFYNAMRKYLGLL